MVALPSKVMLLKLHHSRLQVDSENLKNQADKIKAEAERIADDAERLMSDNQGLIQESYDRRTRLKDDLLERYNNISSAPKTEFDSRHIMFSKKIQIDNLLSGPRVKRNLWTPSTRTWLRTRRGRKRQWQKGTLFSRTQVKPSAHCKVSINQTSSPAPPHCKLT